MSARAATIRTLAAALHRAGASGPLSRLVGRLRRTPAFPILVYHRVNDAADPFFPSVPTDVFDRQIALVARHYRVLAVEDLVERMRRGALPRDAVAITFDDGYRDNLTHAAPVFARHGVPATIFLATGFIGSGEVPWYDHVALAFKLTRADAVDAPWGERLLLGSVADRLAALGTCLERLKRMPHDDMRAGVERLVTTLGVTDRTCLKGLMLTWDDVHALAGLGFSIGAHTVNHPILSRLSAERAWTEILGSRSMIESTCGIAPRAFAYPNGGREDYTATVTHLVREAGFTCAVTARFGLNTEATPPFELRRGGPADAHLPTFALKLCWYRLVRPAAQ